MSIFRFVTRKLACNILSDIEYTSNRYLRRTINVLNWSRCQKIKPSIRKSYSYQMIRNTCSWKNSYNERQRLPLILFGGVLTALGFKEKTPDEKEEELILSIKKGILAIQRSQYEKAERQLHYALKLAQEQNNVNGVTYIYDVLANLAFERGQHEKAETLFISVMQRLMANGMQPDDNKIIHISLKLAKIYQSVKNYEKAEQGFQFCLQHVERKVAEQSEEDTMLLWAMTLDWYARYLLDLNKMNEALPYFRKAYDVCVQVNGKVHEQTVVLLNDLGTLSNMMGDRESAVHYLREAAHIGSKLPEMQNLALIYVNLGQIYLLKEMYKESETACQAGLRRAQENNDEEALSEAKHCLQELEKVFPKSVQFS